jgi:hypothetical protein
MLLNLVGSFIPKTESNILLRQNLSFIRVLRNIIFLRTIGLAILL